MCEICLKLTVKTPERRHRCCPGGFIVNFEQISQIVLVFPLLTLDLAHFKPFLAPTLETGQTHRNTRIEKEGIKIVPKQIFTWTMLAEKH